MLEQPQELNTYNINSDKGQAKCSVLEYFVSSMEMNKVIELFTKTKNSLIKVCSFEY